MSRTADRNAIAPPADPSRRWTLDDARETYGITAWGKGYFDLNEAGHVVAQPTRDPSRRIDLKQLVNDLAIRGIHPPLLVRFTDILHHRMAEIARAFGAAIAENDYRGAYRGVYPIKVNQARHVVEEICRFGAQHGFGLEAGSKPELLAVLALAPADAPIVCNGFKDDEFIEMVVLAQKLGKNVLPVVEKWSELELLAHYADRHRVKPKLGVRVKLATHGSGRWETSGGPRSKFGLFVGEAVDALNYLKQRDLADSLALLHFHLGSQITNIRNVKEAVNELARIYVQLKQAGAGLEYLDIGGGLGVDYDGSQTNYESSINYTLAEYASDVVYRIGAVCDEAQVDHPTLISESGRALVAYHSVLVFDVIGATGLERFNAPDLSEPLDEDTPQPLRDLADAHKSLNKRNLTETYHDATGAYDQALSLFALGHLTLEQRAFAERLYWTTCARIEKHTRTLAHVPEELERLPVFLADTYFCNFSLFQSMPDSWAIDQLFPIMPLHRHGEKPTRRATLADITCDSDGKVNKFVGLRDDKDVLELHAYDGSPYHIGAFLVGAYQEILGDLHNLFGDTHAVHVGLDDEDHVRINHVVRGDTVNDVLAYVGFAGKELAEQMRHEVEDAVRAKRITLAESRAFMKYYEAGLSGYTYLEDPSDE